MKKNLIYLATLILFPAAAMASDLSVDSTLSAAVKAQSLEAAHDIAAKPLDGNFIAANKGGAVYAGTTANQSAKKASLTLSSKSAVNKAVPPLKGTKADGNTEKPKHNWLKIGAIVVGGAVAAVGVAAVVFNAIFSHIEI